MGRTILRNINLHAPPGSTVAIMGPTGSGKSSLVNLIPRFYDPDAGQVLIDGIDARELDLAVLRDNMGLVAQETFLFSDTLYGNLTYGREDAPIEQVEKAAIRTGGGVHPPAGGGLRDHRGGAGRRASPAARSSGPAWRGRS